MSHTTNTDVSIAQMACLEVGISAIASFTDTSTEGIVLNAHYDTIKNNELGRRFWRFAMGQHTLNRLAAAPVARWDAAYQLPTDIINIKSLQINGKYHIPFDRYGDTLLCDAGEDDTVTIDASNHVVEAKWPPYFSRLIVLRLATLLATGVREDAEMGQLKFNEAELQYRMAKNQDSQARSTQAMRATRITNSRSARGGLRIQSNST